MYKTSGSDTIVEFKYNSEGLRVQKDVTVNGSTTTTQYILNGKQLAGMVCGSDRLHFFYDAQGRPTKVDFNGVLYSYVHNLQGDIVGIVDGNGTLVVEYKYDAWGRLLSTTGALKDTLGKQNPFRYRSYVCDEETGVYYLRSRCYNPKLQRFFNADDYLGVQGNLRSTNVYSYCYNNPAQYVDTNGDIPQAVTDGMVHDKVLEEICKQNGDLVYRGTCIYYNGSNFLGGWGFCDLYNKQTGEVWELKKVSDSPSCQTKNAQKQLNGYLSGRLKAKPSLPLKKPYTTVIQSKSFAFERYGYIYHVTYFTEGNGILRYDYTRTKTEELKQSDAAKTITFLLGIILSLLAGGPSMAGAPAF